MLQLLPMPMRERSQILFLLPTSSESIFVLWSRSSILVSQHAQHAYCDIDSFISTYKACTFDGLQHNRSTTRLYEYSHKERCTVRGLHCIWVRHCQRNWNRLRDLRSVKWLAYNGIANCRVFNPYFNYRLTLGQQHNAHSRTNNFHGI
jgi:hypothetical protein